MQQEVGERRELDVVELRNVRSPSAQCRLVTCDTSHLCKQLCSFAHDGRVGIATRRCPQRTEIEHHRVQHTVGQFRIHHTVTALRTDLTIVQVARNQVARDPHVFRVGEHRLMQQVDGARLLSETTDVLAIDRHMTRGRRAGRDRGHRCDVGDEVSRVNQRQPSRDTVPICIGRIGQGANGRILHGLEKPESRDAGRCETRRCRGACRNTFRLISGNRAVLQLRPTFVAHVIERTRRHTAEARDVEQRMALAVAHMAGFARRGHEQGPEPVDRRKVPSKFGVALGVHGHLTRCQPVDRTSQHEAVVRCAGKEWIAT